MTKIIDTTKVVDTSKGFGALGKHQIGQSQNKKIQQKANELKEFQSRMVRATAELMEKHKLMASDWNRGHENLRLQCLQMAIQVLSQAKEPAMIPDPNREGRMKKNPLAGQSVQFDFETVTNEAHDLYSWITKESIKFETTLLEEQLNDLLK